MRYVNKYKCVNETVNAKVKGVCRILSVCCVSCDVLVCVCVTGRCIIPVPEFQSSRVMVPVYIPFLVLAVVLVLVHLLLLFFSLNYIDPESHSTTQNTKHNTQKNSKRNSERRFHFIHNSQSTFNLADPDFIFL